MEGCLQFCFCNNMFSYTNNVSEEEGCVFTQQNFLKFSRYTFRKEYRSTALAVLKMQYSIIFRLIDIPENNVCPQVKMHVQLPLWILPPSFHVPSLIEGRRLKFIFAMYKRFIHLILKESSPSCFLMSNVLLKHKFFQLSKSCQNCTFRRILVLCGRYELSLIHISEPTRPY